jgi:hypothetical protein
VVTARRIDVSRPHARDGGSASRRALRCALACFALLLAALAASPAWARVRVEVDRDPVVADESFTITFTTESKDQSEPDFTPLDKDFEVLGRSSQTSLQIINGRPEARQSWVLNVIAKRSGKVEVPAIAFGSERSAPLTLDVRAAAPGSGIDSDVFITVEATPQPAYVQAQIVVNVRLYVGVQVGSASLSELTAEGAVVEKLGDDRRHEEMRGGRPYTVFERRYAVFAERSGTLTLAPIEFAGELLGRGFFGRYKRTASEAMDLRILPAPADVVPWLPATALTLTEQWPQEPPAFQAGEPLTRTLTLTAKGLTAAQLPPLGGGSADGFKQYVDQPELNDVVADDGVTGVREEKVAFLPTQAGRYTLAPIEVTWWDTRSQSLQVVRVPEREVEVLPGDRAPARGSSRDGCARHKRRCFTAGLRRASRHPTALARRRRPARARLARYGVRLVVVEPPASVTPAGRGGRRIRRPPHGPPAASRSLWARRSRRGAGRVARMGTGAVAGCGGRRLARAARACGGRRSHANSMRSTAHATVRREVPGPAMDCGAASAPKRRSARLGATRSPRCCRCIRRTSAQRAEARGHDLHAT